MLPTLETTKTHRCIMQDFTKGIMHRYGGGERCVFDCENVSGAQYPALAPRMPRRSFMYLSEGVLGMYCADSLYIASDGELYRAEGENSMQLLGTVNYEPKVFGSLGNELLVLPDFKVLDTIGQNLFSKRLRLTLANVLVHNQDYVDEEGIARTIRRNTLHCTDYNFLDFFHPGDSVRIEGTQTNDGYYTVRGVEEFDLRFDEKAFVAEDIEKCMLIKDAPALQGTCTSEDRLWGYAGNTIYACAQGEIANWYRYDGDARSSYRVCVADKGAFTGCVMHAGHPVFFKSDCMVEVYGDSPANYALVQTRLSGVAQGSGASLCSVGGSMLYLSHNGVMRCSGGSARVISDALGVQLKNGVATTDGRRYYLCAEDESGRRALYIYDTETDAWHKEDDAQGIRHLGYLGGDVFAYCDNHAVYILGQDTTGHGTAQGVVESYVDFHPITDNARGEIVPVRLGLRVWCDTGSTLQLFVSYDGEELQERATLQAVGERLWYVPLAARACHTLGVRVRGTGNYRICALIGEYQ
ncbi:MAG: hypothetical protein IIW17_00410 [Clostridia bacterium]|nr:hypothetical protein [Clostridia bacterium]